MHFIIIFFIELAPILKHTQTHRSKLRWKESCMVFISKCFFLFCFFYVWFMYLFIFFLKATAINDYKNDSNLINEPNLLIFMATLKWRYCYSLHTVLLPLARCYMSYTVDTHFRRVYAGGKTKCLAVFPCEKKSGDQNCIQLMICVKRNFALQFLCFLHLTFSNKIRCPLCLFCNQAHKSTYCYRLLISSRISISAHPCLKWFAFHN